MFSNRLSNQLMTDPSKDPSPENAENESNPEFAFSEDEIFSKDSNLDAFIQLPSSSKNMSNFEKHDSILISNNSVPSFHSWQRTFKTSEELLKNTLNKLYYNKVRTLLNERLEGISDVCTTVNFEKIDQKNEDGLSPKSLHEIEFNKERTNNLLYLKKNDRYEALWNYNDNYSCLKFRITIMKIQ